MHPSDLLSAAPGLIAVGLLPGLVIATLAVPRWPLWWRLACAPGLSVGAVGILGLLFHDARVPFAPQTVLPAVGVLCALGTALAARRRVTVDDASTEERPSRRATRVVLVAALVAGAVSTGVAVASLSANPLPFDSDSAIHAAYAEAIARHHDVFPVVQSPVDGSAIVRQRAAAEATAAAVSWLGGPRPAFSVVPLTLLSVLMLPLGLAMLVLEATGSWRLAALAPLLGVGMPVVHMPMTLGEFPLIIDTTLVVPLVIGVLRIVRRRRAAGEVALVAACVAGVLVIHGLEILTAAAVGGPLIAWVALRARPVPWERLLLVAGAALGALVVVMLVTWVPSVPAAHSVAGGGVTTSLAPLFLGTLGRPQDVAETLSSFAQTDLVTPVHIALYAVALVAVLRARRMGWAVATHVLLLVALADVGYTHLLGPLWTALYPWAVADRLASMQYWALAPLLAFGAVWLWDTVRGHRPAAAVDPDLPAVGAAAVPGLVAGAGLLASLGLAARADHALYATLSRGTEVTTTVDVAALRRLDSLVPPGTVVLTNGEADGGQWLDALTRDVAFAPLEYNRSHIYGTTGFTTSDRAFALAHACSDPARAAAALDGVPAVYVGAAQQASSSHRWDEGCIAALPGVRVLFRTTGGGLRATVLATPAGGHLSRG